MPPVGRAVTLKSAPDVMEFYEANPDGFTVAQPGDLPSGLEWVTGAELKEFASPEAKREAHSWNTRRTTRAHFGLWGRTPMGRFGVICSITRGVSFMHPNGDGYYPRLAKNGAMGQTVHGVFPDRSHARCLDGKPLKVITLLWSLHDAQ